MQTSNNIFDKVNTIINNFVSQFDCYAEAGYDFAYHSDKNLITYSFVVLDDFAESFPRFAESIHPVKADIFLWSLLHEIGHHETEDDFTEEEEEEYREIASSNISAEEYYNLPIEYAATDWAGEYMETHSAEVAQFWNELAPAIQEVYKAMEVE